MEGVGFGFSWGRGAEEEDVLEDFGGEVVRREGGEEGGTKVELVLALDTMTA